MPQIQATNNYTISTSEERNSYLYKLPVLKPYPIRKDQYPSQQRNRRTRTAFTNDQTNQLICEFRKEKYLDKNRRREIAQRLSLCETQVKIWFQNMRMKCRRDQLASQRSYNYPTYQRTETVEQTMHRNIVQRLMSYSQDASHIRAAYLAAQQPNYMMTAQLPTIPYPPQPMIYPVRPAPIDLNYAPNNQIPSSTNQTQYEKADTISDLNEILDNMVQNSPSSGYNSSNISPNNSRPPFGYENTSSININSVGINNACSDNNSINKNLAVEAIKYDLENSARTHNSTAIVYNNNINYPNILPQ